jgi:D-methionine transport system substrate-binding protein
MKCTKLILLLAGAVFAACIGALTGCVDNKAGGKANDASAVSTAKAAQEVTVKIGVTGAVYEELWAPAKEALKAEGINLVTVQFSDYVTPNNALANGEIDLNGFQHQAFLKGELASHKYPIQNIGNTFLTPQSLYSKKVASVSDLKAGSVVAIPNDPSNGGRAIKVLQAAGLITLKEGASFSPGISDIASIPSGIVIQEFAANTIPYRLQYVSAASINANYALDFGLKASDAIFADPLMDKEYWNLIAARTADLADPAKVEIYRKIVKAYQSPATEAIYNGTFSGFYIPVGWDEGLLASAK